MIGLLRKHAGVAGFLYAFAAVDAVGAWIVLGLAGTAGLGLTAAIAAVGIALFGFRDTAPPAARTAVLMGIITLLLVLPQLVLISEQTPNSPLHDGILLTDAAGVRLVHGQDPYGHDYIDSLARSFYLSDVPVNFGLAHYVYMPGMILLDLPIRLAALLSPYANFSWMFLPALVALAAGAWLAGGRTRSGAEAAVVMVLLNPLFQLDYLYFLNDLFFLAPLLAAIGFLRRDRTGWAGLLFGAAISIKQQAVLLLPLLLLYTLLHRDAGRLPRAALGAASVIAAVVLPFLLWNPAAFIGDVAGFFYGSGVSAYPIRGLGLPGILLRAGLIPNRWAPYPTATLVQAGLALLILVLAVRDLRRRWSWAGFWLWNALLTACVFFFGRVLAPNYLDLVATFALLGLASGLVGEAPVVAAVGDVNASSGDGRVVGDAAHDHARDLVVGEQGGA